MRAPILTKLALIPCALVLLGAQGVPPDLVKTGEQAYLYAYPLVLTRVMRGQVYPAVGSNTFIHRTEFPSAKYRDIVRPNADTLYSFARLDLSKEPVLLHVPDTHNRYYVAQVMDAWTETLAAPGKRTTGTGEGWFAITGPGWSGKLPEIVRRIDSPTQRAGLALRIQTNTAADYKNVHALQRQFWLIPLSQYPKSPNVPPVMVTPSQNTVPPPQTVTAMSTTEFFTIFAGLLANNPPHTTDGPMVKQLAAVGIEAGKPFSAEKLDPSFERGVTRAKHMLDNSVKLAAEWRNIGKTGWSAPMDLGRYGVDYTKRAVVARIGIGALLPEDAVYMACGRDSDGAVLDGTRHYVVHFEKAQLPPVQGFWSITVYDQAGYFAANPLNRYAIGDRNPLRYNSDGSLDLYIQHETPGRKRQNNWLPAPAAPFSLQFRLYWPKESVLKGEWVPPVVTPTSA